MRYLADYMVCAVQCAELAAWVANTEQAARLFEETRVCDVMIELSMVDFLLGAQPRFACHSLSEQRRLPRGAL